MSIIVRPYTPADLPALRSIWNEIVEDGIAFPQLSPLAEGEAAEFFAAQSHTAVAAEGGSGAVLGLYILHPNNVGRCGHICNTSYAVTSSARGRGVGELLVCDSLVQGRRLGFHILQFNAVVATNPARHLYKRLGFTELGKVPGGFLLKNGSYEDIVLYYHTL